MKSFKVSTPIDNLTFTLLSVNRLEAISVEAKALQLIPAIPGPHDLVKVAVQDIYKMQGTFIEESLTVVGEGGVEVTAGIMLVGSSYNHVHDVESLTPHLVLGFHSVPKDTKVYICDKKGDRLLDTKCLEYTWWYSGGAKSVMVKVVLPNFQTQVIEFEAIDVETLVATIYY